MSGERRFDEARLRTGALWALALLGAPATLAATLVAGAAGAAGAVAGLVLVGILFASGAHALRRAGGRRPMAMVTTLVLGLMGRLLAYAAILAGLEWLDVVHRPTVAVTTGVAIAVVLLYEVYLLARMPRLFWVDADTHRLRAVSNATRSQPL